MFISRLFNIELQAGNGNIFEQKGTERDKKEMNLLVYTSKIITQTNH